jgi:hypothetical protein
MFPWSFQFPRVPVAEVADCDPGVPEALPVSHEAHGTPKSVPMS